MLWESNNFGTNFPGSGVAAKLVNQLLVGVHAQVASEAISLAEDLGLTDVNALLQLLNSAWGNSVMLQVITLSHRTHTHYIVVSNNHAIDFFA